MILPMHNRLLILLLMFLCVPPTTQGVENNKYVLQESSYKVLNEARDEMDKGENSKALARLKKLLPEISDMEYDTAVVYQTMGYIYHALDEIDNAITAFIKSAESGKLPPDVTHDLYYVIAQLSIYKDQHKTGLEYLKKWFADEPNPKADAHLLAASVYFELDDYNQAIPHLKAAIRKSEKPPENWYEMLLSAYLQTEQFKSAAALLEDMIVRYPDHKDFWLQLAAVYQQSGQGKKALAISELAYTRGLLNKDETLNLAKSYLYFDMPYKAGDLITRELLQGESEKDAELLKLLVNSWLSAQEFDKAIDVLEQLVRIDNDPANHFRLAQLLVEKEQWQAALKPLKTVIKSSSFEQLGEAWLLLGMCQYELKDKKASFTSFTNALQHDRSHDQAQWWVDQLTEEQDENLADS